MSTAAEAAERQLDAATACTQQAAPQCWRARRSASQGCAPAAASQADMRSQAAATHEAERRSREAGAGVLSAPAAAAGVANTQRAAHVSPALAQHAQQQPSAGQATHSGIGIDDAHPRRAWSLDNGHHPAANGVSRVSR